MGVTVHGKKRGFLGRDAGLNLGYDPRLRLRLRRGRQARPGLVVSTGDQPRRERGRQPARGGSALASRAPAAICRIRLRRPHYEVVWFQLLQLSIGSSAVSLGVLLGIYMGGMCLGSLLLPYPEPAAPPLRVYALSRSASPLGIIVLFAVPIVGRVYTSIAGTGQVSLVLRAIVAASACCHPADGRDAAGDCALGGDDAEGVSWLGYFYGGNLAGAVAGSLLAGFYLLRVFDMPTATAAVALNVVVALLALVIAARRRTR